MSDEGGPGGGEQRVYRIIVISILIIGALGFLWYLSQGGEGIGEDGIFEFFEDPGGSGDQGPGDPEPTAPRE